MKTKTIPSIGGDVTPVFIDNTAGKETPEFEKRFIAGQESAKTQIAEAKAIARAKAEKGKK